MAEYKTFACDQCGKHEAKRFSFPYVDHQDDPVDGKRSRVKGHVDLCLEHTGLMFDALIDAAQFPMEKQRELWKRLLKK